MDKLDKALSCPFCNHGSSVECRIDMKNLIGEANCRICQESFSTTVNGGEGLGFELHEGDGHGAESSSFVVSVMKSEIEKKEAEIMEVKGKYSVLMNLAEAQGRVIRTQKANHLKEKEKLTEENYNLKLQVDKLPKSEDKLNDEIVVLNLHNDGLKKGIENLIKRMG
ncbi:transcription elongation factor 1 [Hordeum vulgare]|nr:transcription elongation factor 1 [Hordeum vulgare]